MSFAISASNDELARICEAANIPYHPAALDNFAQVFAVRAEDRVVLLVDRKIDPRVVDFIWKFARGRGAQVNAITLEKGAIPCFPAFARPLVEQATFVVSTWTGSVMDPYLIGLRRDKGQRWIKITYFRSLDILRSSAARYPIPVIAELIRETARPFELGRPAEIHVTDSRGTDLHITMTADMVDQALKKSRWKGELTAEKPGAFVHYIPTHGPNFYDLTLHEGFYDGIRGVIYPQAAIGFNQTLPHDFRVEVEGNRVVKVLGDFPEREELSTMLMGSCLIELGCGFNPHFPRYQIYPAGSNSPGAMHFGFDFAEASEYIRRKLPDWPEQPLHQDLVTFDSTVTVNGTTAVQGGRLTAMKSEKVLAIAARYGDPINVLEEWPLHASQGL